MAESTSASLGPRYAPEDPTLPKPWTGLIDGSTGLQYYWNPETNVTQYERPASAPPPPLPPGLPPPAATPKLAPLPVAQSVQPNGIQSEPSQQLFQRTSQPQQQSTQQVQHQQPGLQLPYQHPSQQIYPQQGNHFPQQQLEQQVPHQPAGQQVPSQQTGQTTMQQQAAQQFQQQQAGHQAPYQQSGLHLQQQQASQQMSQQQLKQLPYQHVNYPHPQAQQPSGQQIVHQNIQPVAFQKIEDSPFQHGKQVGYKTPEVQPSGGTLSKQNFSSGMPQVHIPQSGVRPLSSQQPIRAASPGSAQQSGASFFQMQQNIDGIQRQQPIGNGSRPANQMVPGTAGNLISTGSPMQLKEYEDDKHGGPGDGFYSNRSKDAPSIGMLQPKLATIPMARNLQEARTGATNNQIFSHGHSASFNMPSVHPMLNIYDNPIGNQPFPNGVPVASSPRMLTPFEFPNLSAVDAYRRRHEVTAMGENIPSPFMTFESTGFPPEILREMHFAGFLSPTPIQAQTWPIALQGRDIVAIAKTGSGKTLGYLVPAFLHLRQRRNNPQIGPTALVLAPTRELATQIQDEAIKFGRSSGISCTCLYGGAPKGPQLREIERGVDIVVATPGRLNDILEMNKINMRQVSFLVLDEADRMLDMGFEPQIRKIVNEVPPRRQTLMYTATWPKEVRKIAGDLLFSPVQVNIGSIDELAANKSITQYVELVPPMEKQRRLEQILRAQERGSKTIIFCSTKRLCDQLARGIARSFGATAIHGDKSQAERDWALNQFRSGKLPVLVATDVAARGLDIKDIRVVINYDFPTGVEDYVHRIGRTGRAGATGVSYTFFSDQDWKHAADLIKVLEGANQRVPPEVREMAARGAPAFSKDRGGISRFDSGGGRWDSGGARGMRDGGFGGRGGRNDFSGGRTGRGRGFSGPGGWGRGGRGPPDRYGYIEGRGGRFDNHRPMGARNRERSYSRSPDRGRAWNRNRSRSYSRSRSRSRSWTRSRSYSRSLSRSRSRSRSFDRDDVPRVRHQNTARVSGFDVLPPAAVAPPGQEVSAMPPGTINTGTIPTNEEAVQMEPALLLDDATPCDPSSEAEPTHF